MGKPTQPESVAHLVDLRTLKPYEGNSRTHSDEQIAQIKASFRQFGFVGVVAYRQPDELKIGHGRQRAALEMWEAGETVMGPGKREPLPKWHAPAVDVTGLTDTECQALVIADNKLALNAGWDDERLRAELELLRAADFDLPVLGFDPRELANIFEPNAGRGDPDKQLEAPAVPATVRGDVWLLGKHRLTCGDATCAADVDRVLAGKKPHLMVTDPPYGVNYDPNWRNVVKRRDGSVVGAKATGKVQNDHRADWREAWELFPGDVAYVWYASLLCLTVQESLEAVGFELRSQIIWAKDQFVIGRGDYHWQHESCLYAVRKGKPGRYVGDRKQSTVWSIAAPSGWAQKKEGQDAHTGIHSTQKMVECMKRPIENNSHAGDPVYEPFCGSGTTIIAGEITGRSILALELNPAYCDVTVRRWQEFTGQEARLEGDGRTFAEVEAERLAVSEAGTEPVES